MSGAAVVELEEGLLDTTTLPTDSAWGLGIVTGVLAMLVAAWVVVVEGDVVELLAMIDASVFVVAEGEVTELLATALLLSGGTGSIIAFPVPQHVLLF